MTRLEIAGYAAAAAAIVGLAIVFNDDNKHEPPSPDPDEPPPPRPTVPTWYELHGATLALVRGRRYRGCVSIPAPASWAITNAMVASRAEREGFTDVRVVDDRPSGWPDADCKWYVEATWGGADTLFSRPSVVTRAWWLVPP